MIKLPDAWPQVAFFLLILAFLLVAMWLTAAHKYRFQASFIKFIFEPGLPATDVAQNPIPSAVRNALVEGATPTMSEGIEARHPVGKLETTIEIS